MAAGEKLKETTEKVKQIVSEQLGVDEAEVTPSASFVDDLGADSLDQVELVMALEEAFDLEIPDDVRNLLIELVLNGGLEKTRTSDLFRVKEAL